MSRFFRSGDSSTSSEDEDEDEIDVGAISESHATSGGANAPSSQLAALNVVDNGQGQAVNQGSEQWTSHHKDVLLHALLENWCHGETPQTNGGVHQDESQIQAEAHTRYLRLVSQLASLNVLPSELADDQHAAMRQRYRDGLGALSRQHSATAMSSGVRRMLTDGSADALQPLQSLLAQSSSQHLAQNQLALQAPLTRLLGFEEHGAHHNPFGSTLPSPSLRLTQNRSVPVYCQTRYNSDFEELSILGRGGYGVVYRVRHHLDGQDYAIKKVRLSEARLHRIRTRGQPEVDEILRELQTLAKVYHPNIVRYFGAWLEMTDPSTSCGLDDLTSTYDTTDDRDSMAGASNGESGILRDVFTDDENNGDGIIIGESDGDDVMRSEEGLGASHGGSQELSQLRRARSVSATVTGSDGSIESIDREPDVFQDSQSTADGASLSRMTPAVHLQMAVYPMTLSGLLDSTSGESHTMQHCYHLRPSVGIAMAVLEGLEYLHDENIIHRDIKPANIFLSPKKARGSRRNGVDLNECGDCHHGDDFTNAEVDVCIGDFGLATVANPENAETHPANPSSPVGTAIYRPPSTEVRSTNLDIYALGIVFFELLWKFDTKMERDDTISKLKKGSFPSKFCEWIGEGKAEMTRDCIDCMLSRDAQGSTIQEVKEKLSALIAPTR